MAKLYIIRNAIFNPAKCQWTSRYTYQLTTGRAMCNKLVTDRCAYCIMIAIGCATNRHRVRGGRGGWLKFNSTKPSSISKMTESEAKKKPTCALCKDELFVLLLCIHGLTLPSSLSGHFVKERAFLVNASLIFFPRIWWESTML
jgi:hypothetical protein